MHCFATENDLKLYLISVNFIATLQYYLKVAALQVLLFDQTQLEPT